MKRVPVANRGEVALRVIRAYGKLDLATILGFHRQALAPPDFLDALVHTCWVETELANV